LSTSLRATYHHGDLRAALVEVATQAIAEQGEVDLSLRDIARRAGVSPGAPYRHFADKDALLAAVATRGYDELRQRLLSATESVSDSVYEDLAVAYVTFALDHPGLFRLMFTHPCSRSAPDTAAAAAAAAAVFADVVGGREGAAALVTGGWALAHGLAMLLIDGKLHDTRSPDAIVRTAVAAVLTGSPE
jgi:AcrR family transcriptional regulator